MQDWPKRKHVGLGKSPVEKVAGLKVTRSVSRSREVVVEDRFHLRQVEADAVKVRLSERNLRDQIALRGADVGADLYFDHGNVARWPGWRRG